MAQTPLAHVDDELVAFFARGPSRDEIAAVNHKRASRRKGRATRK